MAKTIDEFLKILYPNVDTLSEDKRKKYLKDKEFLTTYIEEFNAEYNLYINSLEEFGEYNYTTAVLDLCKEKLDRETIIIQKTKSILNELMDDSYISSNFEGFLEVMQEERKQEELAKKVVLDNTEINLTTVFELTEKFLKQIDPSEELLSEFRLLQNQGRILIHSPEDKNTRSNYKDDRINFVFDGTVNSAHKLIHEFMHHWIEIKSHPTMNREEHTLLSEFESIYYENAFIKFMSDEWIVKCGELPLMAERLRKEYDRDPNNCILILLELCKVMKDSGNLDKESIISIFKKYHPNISNEDELWKNGAEILTSFLSRHFHTGELVSGPIMYRFNAGLAMQTSYDLVTQQNIFKLAPLIKDRMHDHLFMEEYNRVITQAKEQTISFPAVEESTRKTIYDRIPLSSCIKVKDESEIPGNFTSVTGEYIVPSENRTGFYKLNCSFGNNPDLRELLSSLLLKKINVPVADIILVYDEKRNENGCISMSILQEGEKFLSTDDYDLQSEIARALPKDITGLDRFIASDIQYYAQKYNLPPEALEYRRKFLIEYAFISAFLGNDDLKTDNCQMIYNEKNSTIRNPEYYDMGMAFEGPAISTKNEYTRYFFGNQLDTDVLRELYEKYPKEIEGISTRISQFLDRDYLKNILSQEVFQEMDSQTLDNIWAHMGTKISYIARQNELLYGISNENNSFVTSLDEVEEISHGQNLSLIDKARRFFSFIKQIILGEEQK